VVTHHFEQVAFSVSFGTDPSPSTSFSIVNANYLILSEATLIRLVQSLPLLGIGAKVVGPECITW
jgi:hypothetical protein